jgi:carbon-monoxide dehydrogenase large subunit
MAPIKFGVGQSVPRKEDDALIRGKGRYTDDFALQPALHALVLRSPHAHAKYIIAPVGISFSSISVSG